MKIAYVTAGAAGRYCGNCLRDNLLALTLRRLGEDVVLVPTYTPIRAEAHDASEKRLFFNGVRVFLEQKYAFFRKPRPLLDRLLGSRTLLRALSRFGASTDARQLGELTLSMLRGDQGHQKKELEELAEWLARDVQPDVVHLSNALLVGMAPRLREVLKVPVVCGLQAEDSFLDRLSAGHREAALRLIREQSADLDGLVAVSEYYADHVAESFGLSRDKISVVLPGVDLEGHEPVTRARGEPLSVGYLARIAPEKGLHLLCDAFRTLASQPEFSTLRLKVAGYLAGDCLGYAAGLRGALSRAGVGDRVEFVGTVDRQGKLEFLRGVDVLAVPTVYPDPKGLFVLEALASGIPVVAPRHGAFPEIIAKTGGGVLCEPEDPDSLAAALRELLHDTERRHELGERGRRAVEEGFSAERMARETLSIYQGLRSGAAT